MVYNSKSHATLGIQFFDAHWSDSEVAQICVQFERVLISFWGVKFTELQFPNYFWWKNSWNGHTPKKLCFLGDLTAQIHQKNQFEFV